MKHKTNYLNLLHYCLLIGFLGTHLEASDTARSSTKPTSKPATRPRQFPVGRNLGVNSGARIGGTTLFRKDIANGRKLFVDSVYYDPKCFGAILYLDENGKITKLASYVPELNVDGVPEVVMWDANIEDKLLIDLYGGYGVSIAISPISRVAITDVITSQLVNTKDDEKIIAAKLSGTLKDGNLTAEITKTTNDPNPVATQFVFKIELKDDKIVAEEIKQAKK